MIYQKLTFIHVTEIVERFINFAAFMSHFFFATIEGARFFYLFNCCFRSFFFFAKFLDVGEAHNLHCFLRIASLRNVYTYRCSTRRRLRKVAVSVVGGQNGELKNGSKQRERAEKGPGDVGRVGEVVERGPGKG